MMRKLLLIIALLTWVVPAWAGGSSIGFTGFSGGDGNLSFTPGSGDALTISGALITDVLNNLGVCGGDCSVSGGAMSVTTGGQSSVSNPVAGVYIYTFAAGGTLTVTGGISSLGIAPGTTLFSATFANGGTFTVSGSSGTFSANINLASITLNPKLGTFVYSGGGSEAISIDLNLLCSSGGACTGSIIQASADLGVISEPSTLVLLGSGLATFAGVIRRRKWLART
jgi:hypothetical protein